MNSHIVELNIPMEIEMNYDTEYGAHLSQSHVVYNHVPWIVKKWLKDHSIESVTLTQEEVDDMPAEILRNITFEVEIFTKEVQGVVSAYRAECHTVCPGFVAAWVEVEAMKQFNSKKEAEKCTS